MVFHSDDSLSQKLVGTSKNAAFNDDRQTPKKSTLIPPSSIMTLTKPNNKLPGIAVCDLASSPTKSTQFQFGGKSYQVQQVVVSQSTIALINTNHDLKS